MHFRTNAGHAPPDACGGAGRTLLLCVPMPTPAAIMPAAIMLPDASLKINSAALADRGCHPFCRMM